MELTYKQALWTLISSSVKCLESVLVHAKFRISRFVRTIHVPNKVNFALLKPFIRLECATQCNCTLKFSHVLERVSCRDGKFCNV